MVLPIILVNREFLSVDDSNENAAYIILFNFSKVFVVSLFIYYLFIIAIVDVVECKAFPFSKRRSIGICKAYKLCNTKINISDDLTSQKHIC